MSNQTTFNTYGKRSAYNCFAVVVAASLILQLALSLVIMNGNDVTVIWANGVYSVALALTAYVYARTVKADIVTVANIRKFDYRHLLFGLAFVLLLVNVMTPVNEWLGDLIEAAGLKRPSVGIVISTETLPAVIIVACVVAAFTEEFVFRGMIGNTLAESGIKGIALSGLLFSLFHMNPAQTVHQFVLGCALTIAVRRGGFFTCVALHMFNNILAVVLSLTLEPTGFYSDHPLEIFFVSLILLLVLCAVYVKVFPFKKNNEGGQKPDGYVAVTNAGFILAVIFCAAMWVLVLFS